MARTKNEVLTIRTTAEVKALLKLAAERERRSAMSMIEVLVLDYAKLHGLAVLDYADKFDYMLSNPPFGVDWKKVEGEIKNEHKLKGFDGRFGPGLPRVSDGSLLFLMHLLAKMRDYDANDGNKNGGRIGIILNGSPLFTGGAGSGESEIRRHILESDLLEAIVALPTDIFYNTGIATYVWVLSNKKAPARRGKVQLINGVHLFRKMRKSLGSKRQEVGEDDIALITRTFGRFEAVEPYSLDKEPDEKRHRGRPSATKKKAENKTFGSKIFDSHAFGYRRITVERPLRLSVRFTDERIAELRFPSGPLNAVMRKVYELDTKERKQLLNAVTWTNPDAEPVIKKRLKTRDGNRPDPMFGAFEYRGQIVQFQPDSNLRDSEDVPLTAETARGANVNAVNDAYFNKEVAPHVSDAWIDASKCDERDGQIGVVGYEIPFNRHFYQYEPPRDLAEIDADLDVLSAEIMEMLREVHS